MTLTRVGLTVILGLIADHAIAQTIHGTATYRERMTLPAGAAQTGPGSSKSAGSPSPSNRPLEATHWKAIELVGKPVPAQAAKGEAHLVFQGGRVSGSDGCNRIMGSYDLKGEGVTFGQLAGTQMACADTADVERGFHAALKTASRWTIAGDRLELLVRFRGGDDTTLTPDDRANYTIEFGPEGRLTARIDCNRGRGTWKTTGSSQLELGPLALTRAKCPEGSLHDRIVKQWSFIRSFVITEGHLFLALMADGGTYEFEPLMPNKQ